MEPKKVISKVLINARADEQKKTKIIPRIFDVVICGVLTLIFFLCPLFFTGLVAQIAGFEKMILFYFLVLSGVVVWVIKGVVVGELKLKRTPLDLSILALLASFIISTILSVNPKISLIGSYGNVSKSLIAVIVYILFYYFLVNNINAKRIKLMFWSIIISASIIAVYSLSQVFGLFILPFSFTKFINFNPLGSMSALTSFLAIVLPLFVVGACQLREIHTNLRNKIVRNIIKSALVVLSFFVLIGLFLLNNFTFWPAVIVGMVIVLMFFLSKVVKICNSNIVMPIVVFALLIIFFVLGNFNIINFNLPAEISLSRSVSWQIARDSIIKKPIFGSGPSTFDYNFSQYKNVDFNNSPLWNTDFNDPSGVLFESMANVGGLGTMALVVIVLISLSLSFISLIKNNVNDLQSVMLGLFASFITIIILALLLELNNSLILISIIISVLSIVVSIETQQEKFKSVSLTFRASPKYALALAAIFLTVSAGVVIFFTLGVKMYLADMYAMKSVKTAEIDKKINYLNKAVQLASYRDIYYVSLANNYMAKVNQEINSGKNQTVIENALSLAIENGKKAVEIAPNNVANNEALALIYENASFYTKGALEWAENLYKKVIELEPNSPTPYLRIALINMARVNEETNKDEQTNYINEAIKKYDEAIAKKNNFDLAYYGKAMAYEKLDKTDEAVEQLKKAVSIAEDKVDYRFELGRMLYNRGSANIGKAENQEVGGAVLTDNDLKTAEQIFLSIIRAYPKHSNTLYSLALLYQKIGDTDNAKIMVASLLANLTDQSSIALVKKQFAGLY